MVVVNRVVGLYGENYRFCEEAKVWEKMRGRLGKEIEVDVCLRKGLEERYGK